MEDDDEFEDLCTDVLMPFSSSASKPQQSSTTAHLLRSMDSDPQSDNTISNAVEVSSSVGSAALGSISISAPEPMVLDSKQEAADWIEIVFDIEEGSKAIEGVGSDDPIILGLTESVPLGDSGRNDDGGDIGIKGSGQVEAEGEGDDWDSDSEDDLQIVLNDNNHGPMAMERGGMMGEDDDDEDGDPLMIVADGDANQGIEEQNWGEEIGRSTNGKKEGGEVGFLKEILFLIFKNKNK